MNRKDVAGREVGRARNEKTARRQVTFARGLTLLRIVI
jgi:hypothetical protein